MNYSLPQDFIKRMKEYLGEEYDAFIASYENQEVKGIRFRPIKGDDIRQDEMKKLSEKVLNRLDGVSDIPWVNYGFSYCDNDEALRPGKHPYHEAGVYYIQEPSAMSPVAYLDVKPGDRVLDLCAAPGGKSTQIAALMHGQGILVSNEIMPDRAKILSENIERMGVRNALVISEDPRNISDRFAGFFDRILVDAPCSGEGMFRRSETAVNEWSLENVDICAKRQEWILDEAAKMLSPGGRLVYSTCTFSKEEDEQSVEKFLSRHDDFRLAEMQLFDGMRRGYGDTGVRIWPHLVSSEGHYVCALDKNASGDYNGEPKKYMPPCGYQTDMTKKERADLKEMFSFLESNITDSEFESGEIKNRRFTKFKDQIYMLPSECPSLNGIKVLRAGLHIGTVLKNRFEPGHALAKCLDKTGVKNYYDINVISDDADTKEGMNLAVKYISGETFNLEGENGWYLILTDGCSVGWGKLTNGIMKNHYPKGLRKRI